MSCTRLGRIRKLIKKNLATTPMQSKKTPKEYKDGNALDEAINQNNTRRLKQIEILIKISKEGFRPKKKLAVKKVKTTTPGTGKRKKK